MKKTIKLLDLDCGHCADKIQNAVKKIDGVTSVSVNFLGQKMVLELSLIHISEPTRP